jgi:hypothetical protein
MVAFRSAKDRQDKYTFAERKATIVAFSERGQHGTFRGWLWTLAKARERCRDLELNRRIAVEHWKGCNRLPATQERRVCWSLWCRDSLSWQLGRFSFTQIRWPFQNGWRAAGYTPLEIESRYHIAHGYDTAF